MHAAPPALVHAAKPALVHEPARALPVLAEAEVVVLGGGPAGMAAAVAAARLGARTLLVERYGFLGGMGTAGGVTNFAGLYGRHRALGSEMQLLVRGVAAELLDRIEALGGLNTPQDGLQGRIRVRSYDIPAYKCAADALLAEAGVQLLFHAWAAGVATEGVPQGGRIDALIVETKSGRMALRGREFVDASGDADLAAAAGLAFTYGDGAGNALYPSTMFRLGGVDATRAQAAVGGFGAIDRLMDEASARWRFPRRGAILRPQRNPAEWRANVTQLADADGRAANGVDARSLSAAESEGRRQAVEYLRFLRAEVPGFERAEMADIATQVGIRETRRVHCEHMLSGEEVTGGACFDDHIGFNAWPLERHEAGRIEWRFPDDPAHSCNELPYRMLLPQGAANLHVAGRCAGMTHEGQSAARASGACFVMGQAAGTAAALRVQGRFTLEGLQQRLRQDGALLRP